MKKIQKNCMVFFLSCALIQGTMPSLVYAEETEEQEMNVQETADEEMTESAGEEILLPETNDSQNVSETPESTDDEVIEAELLPSDASVNGGMSIDYSSDNFLIVSPHANATLAVSAQSSAGGLKYQWSYYDENTSSYIDIAGAVSASYTVQNITYRTLYRCTVTDAGGNTDSLPFTVAVQNRFEASYVTSNIVYVPLGQSAKLEAKVNAKDKTGMFMEWRDYSGNLLAAGSPVCTVPNVTENKNLYFLAKDRYGNAETLLFTVAVDNGLSAYFENEREFALSGQTVTMTPIINAANKTGLTFQWYANEVNADGSIGKSYPISANQSAASVAVADKDIEIVINVRDQFGNSVYATKRIIAVPVGSVRLLYDRKYVKINDTGSVEHRANGGRRPLWLSTDKNVLSLDGSNYTAHKAGVAKVAAANDTMADSCDFIVMFNDVQNSNKYYFESVYWALTNKITTGVSNQRFAPEDKCTREQIVTFLWRISGSPEPSKTVSFIDVAKSAYYYKAVAWAAEKGITTGVNAYEFGVGQPCTREQVVTFLYRAAGSPATHYHGVFEDNIKGKYYYDAIGWAVNYRITTGVSSFEFGVGTTCTRGMIVTFLDRYINPSYGAVN